MGLLILALAEFERGLKTVGLFFAGGLFVGEELTELGRSVFWNAQRFPIRRFEMLGEEYDLPDMVCVVRKLSVYRLNDCMRFAADRDRLRKIFDSQRFDRAE